MNYLFLLQEIQLNFLFLIGKIGSLRGRPAANISEKDEIPHIETVAEAEEENFVKVEPKQLNDIIEKKVSAFPGMISQREESSGNKYSETTVEIETFEKMKILATKIATYQVFCPYCNYR